MRIPIGDCISYVEAKKSIIPIPDWTQANVTSKDTIILNFDDIYIDDWQGNKTKEETHTAEEIETLRNSFAGGVDTKEFPPAVRYRGPLYDKPYELVYGYGRTEGIQLNNQKRWYFTLLEGDDDAIEDVMAMENEALPKRINKEVDMRKFLIAKVKEGKIANTEKAIRDKFKMIYANRDKIVMNRVVQSVMEAAVTPQPYITYTSTPRVQQWLDNHCSETYYINGEYDNERGMYGMCIKEGYQYRAVIHAITRYHATGEKTYVIGHFSAPTAVATLNSKRKKFIDEFDKIEASMRSCGLTIWPLKYMGFLPSDREHDDIKRLVKLDATI